MIEVIERFLDNDTHSTIERTMKDMPWYYSNVTNHTEPGFMFGHIFYYSKINGDANINSNEYESCVLPVIKKLQRLKGIKKLELLRAKANLYTNAGKQIKHGYHLDLQEDNFNGKIALYNLNTNNGYTEFKPGEKIKSVANSLILFDGNIEHRSVSQTDTDIRMNVNINFNILEGGDKEGVYSY